MASWEQMEIATLNEMINEGTNPFLAYPARAAEFAGRYPEILKLARERFGDFPLGLQRNEESVPSPIQLARQLHASKAEALCQSVALSAPKTAKGDHP